MNKPIAMWSGPRNISTAMMYSFASRPDCSVLDEPFYAWYLKQTGLLHPLRQKILENGELSDQRIISSCAATSKQLVYQKHMTQHMLDGLDRAWIKNINNAFLIRDPKYVLASYTKKRSQVTLADIGIVEQWDIFERVADELGAAPPVVDSEIFLNNPESGLRKLCMALHIPFFKEMLFWDKGAKPYDGVWASHWYEAVWESTGFGAAKSEDVELSEPLKQIADAAQTFYSGLKRYAL